MARHFAASGERIRLSIGSCNLTGAFTLAAISKRETARTTGDYHGLLLNETSANAAAVSFEVAGTVGSEVYNDTGGSGDFGASAYAVADGWEVTVVTKAAGLTQPLLYRYNFTAASWTVDGVGMTGAGTMPDAASQSGGYILISGFTSDGTTFSDSFSGWIALAAEWTSVLSSANVHSLVTNLNTSDWTALTPAGLWELNGTVAAGITDLTGNGANQTAISGTTQDTGNDPPGWIYSAGGVTSAVTLGPVFQPLPFMR